MKGRPVDGIFLLDKPTGQTSNAALQTVKSLFYAQKAGHTGSLDPLASGMLPICFGEATKFSQFLLNSDKHYTVIGKLGEKTETADAEGEVIETREVNVTAEQVAAAVEAFRGETQQIPSMYSALKHNGTPLYKLARQGITVEREPRTIFVHDIVLKRFSDNEVELDIHCSKGTYIRNIIEDIGESLGCGAHVTYLHRNFVGDLKAEDMISLDQLEKEWEADKMSINAHIQSVDLTVLHMPVVNLDRDMSFYFLQGQSIFIPQCTENEYRVYSDTEEFLGVGYIDEEGQLAPKRLISTK
jgi:tRNA pseudouridine55 synthase